VVETGDVPFGHPRCSGEFRPSNLSNAGLADADLPDGTERWPQRVAPTAYSPADRLRRLTGSHPGRYLVPRDPHPIGIRFAFAVSGIIAATVATGWFELGTWRGTDLSGSSNDTDRSVEGATQGEGGDETESGTATSEA
jgi:hypothetical protein